MQAAVKVDDKLILLVTPAGFIFEHVVISTQGAVATSWQTGKGSRQGSVDRSGTKDVKSTNVDVARRNRHVMRQLMLHADHALYRVGRFQTRGLLIDRHRHRKSFQLIRGGDLGEEVRLHHNKLLLVCSVQTLGIESQIFAHAIVEDPKAAANNCLRLLSTAGRPGKTDSGRDIEVTADVCLCFVAETKVQRQVGPQLPIVLAKTTKIELTYFGLGITSRQ